ncbi:mitochondrial mRNA pseudouridine synthase RPUSD3 [Tetranychus urticae]|uniref:mitochondrial mRNA pseudouridine synthase RPUSD3 n=1 Tax=Tetranychus urticae TaxID=32264 RepID=UPI000355C9A7|nr:mitochondrial mRNA pseudouridine synthase RPUSD3 [Tetranychus urticae]
MFTNHIKLALVLPSRSLVNHLHQQATGQSTTTKHTFPSSHVYQRIYNWTHLDQFADHLLSKILLNDPETVCLAKPFGVGIYNAYDKSNHPEKIEPKKFGDPRYCVNDVIDILANKLNVGRLSFAETQDRIFSGIMVLSKSPKGVERIKRSIKVSRALHLSPYTYHCLTYGAPMMKEPIVEEIVAIEQIIVNEKTGEKDTEIIYNPSKSILYKNKDVRKVKAELKVLDYNSSLNVALVELSCSRTNYHFVRCYLASKACFILGDPRFSRRVGHVLGVPYSLNASNKRPREEPLPASVRKILDVPNNKSIPLMLHQVKLCLSKYAKNTDLLVEDYNYPEFFSWTVRKLFGTNTNYK